MSSPRLTLSLSTGASSPNDHRLILEQEPVRTGALPLSELETMLSLARSGISARAYIAGKCPASIDGISVVVPLTLYAWPSHAQPYSLSPAISAWTTIAEGVAIEQERDFDLVVENTNTINLPCLAKSCTVSWQSPAILSNGREIEPPDITGYDLNQSALIALDHPHGPINRLVLARACFGVLRVRCTAIGYQHAITLAIPKGDAKISDVKETVTGSWNLIGGTTDATALQLTLPSCVETLLAACYDDTTVGDHLGTTTETGTRKQLRYSTCTGAVLGYREIEVKR